ncbi:MAG: mechanosensitive ion channel family protein [Firmicutes bacterium]|nr:mechanosensitive ion channel family protein [Bacillota bacterium]
MENILVSFNDKLVSQGNLEVKLFYTILAFVLAALLSKVIYHVLKNVAPDKVKSKRVERSTHLILNLLAIALTLRLWLSQDQSFALIVTIFLAFVALALKDFILDIVAFIYVSYKNTFVIDDVIEIDDRTGQVTDMDFLHFDLAEIGHEIGTLKPTGRYISVPNRFIFEKAIVNYTRSSPFIVQEISLLIPFGEDRHEALELAKDLALKKHAMLLERYDEEAIEVFRRTIEKAGSTIDPKVRSELESNGFRIFIQFLTHYNERGENKRMMVHALYDTFRENDIKILVPTYVRIDH